MRWDIKTSQKIVKDSNGNRKEVTTKKDLYITVGDIVGALSTAKGAVDALLKKRNDSSIKQLGIASLIAPLNALNISFKAFEKITTVMSTVVPAVQMVARASGIIFSPGNAADIVQIVFGMVQTILVGIALQMFQMLKDMVWNFEIKIKSVTSVVSFAIADSIKAAAKKINIVIKRQVENLSSNAIPDWDDVPGAIKNKISKVNDNLLEIKKGADKAIENIEFSANSSTMVSGDGSTEINIEHAFAIIINGTGGRLIAGSSADEGLWFSDNQGSTWTQSNIKKGNFISIDGIANPIVYCAGAYSTNSNPIVGIYKTTDNGVTWSLTNKTTGSWSLIKAVGTNLVACGNTDQGLCYSSNGTSFSNSNITSGNYETIVLLQKFYNAMASGNLIYGTKDNGATWSLISAHKFNHIIKVGSRLIAASGEDTGLWYSDSDKGVSDPAIVDQMEGVDWIQSTVKKGNYSRLIFFNNVVCADSLDNNGILYSEADEDQHHGIGYGEIYAHSNVVNGSYTSFAATSSLVFSAGDSLRKSLDGKNWVLEDLNGEASLTEVTVGAVKTVVICKMDCFYANFIPISTQNSIDYVISDMINKVVAKYVSDSLIGIPRNIYQILSDYAFLNADSNLVTVLGTEDIYQINKFTSPINWIEDCGMQPLSALTYGDLIKDNSIVPNIPMYDFNMIRNTEKLEELITTVKDYLNFCETYCGDKIKQSVKDTPTDESGVVAVVDPLDPEGMTSALYMQNLFDSSLRDGTNNLINSMVKKLFAFDEPMIKRIILSSIHEILQMVDASIKYNLRMIYLGRLYKLYTSANTTNANLNKLLSTIDRDKLNGILKNLRFGDLRNYIKEGKTITFPASSNKDIYSCFDVEILKDFVCENVQNWPLNDLVKTYDASATDGSTISSLLHPENIQYEAIDASDFNYNISFFTGLNTALKKYFDSISSNIIFLNKNDDKDIIKISTGYYKTVEKELLLAMANECVALCKISPDNLFASMDTYYINFKNILFNKIKDEATADQMLDIDASYTNFSFDLDKTIFMANFDEFIYASYCTSMKDLHLKLTKEVGETKDFGAVSDNNLSGLNFDEIRSVNRYLKEINDKFIERVKELYHNSYYGIVEIEKVEKEILYTSINGILRTGYKNLCEALKVWINDSKATNIYSVNELQAFINNYKVATIYELSLQSVTGTINKARAVFSSNRTRL